MNLWAIHAHAVIARRQADRLAHEFAPELGVLDLNRCSMFTAEESEVVAPRVSAADLGTPVSDPRLGHYLPGFGKPQDNTSASRRLRRLDLIAFHFIVLPE